MNSPLTLGTHVEPELQLCVPISQCVEVVGSSHNIPDHPGAHTHLQITSHYITSKKFYTTHYSVEGANAVIHMQTSLHSGQGQFFVMMGQLS